MYLFLSINVKETLSWKVSKCDSFGFNNFCYKENDIKTFQRVDEVLQKLIEIKKKNKAVTNIPSTFQYIFITFMLCKICYLFFLDYSVPLNLLSNEDASYETELFQEDMKT